ncbi:HepT-like ribonuclease domain-containing protein [Dyadobacter psychrotolerans]|uniref:DUF86 domain-containing protein n=1 Tax=Dyadobacter psychrotolerans TaxID=2541721 RepID=A0A4V2Z3T1_9BACT|nr:HepT-like ribonuclease domain-containing protein [Dyadobacter psychrotolerans]TDE13848.1 DUF86 domain-containing protein [Dyadobacter psychrotolerans]
MSPLLIEFLQHIENELSFIDKNTSELDFEEFVNNEILTKAIVRSFEIVGEACKKVPDEIRFKYPLFDWRGFAGLRDRMIHHYLGIDYALLWDAIKTEIPFNLLWIKLIIEREH